jgi:hypothetical protein
MRANACHFVLAARRSARRAEDYEPAKYNRAKNSSDNDHGNLLTTVPLTKVHQSPDN